MYKRQVPDRLQGGIYMILIQLSFLPDIGDRKCFHLDFPFLISGEMAAAEMPEMCIRDRISVLPMITITGCTACAGRTVTYPIPV